MNARKSFVSILFVCILLLGCTPTAGQPYGSPATSVTDCFTSEPTITSVDSGFCEGISPDLPGPGSRLPGATDRLGSETTIAFVPAWTGAGGFHEAGLVMGFNGTKARVPGSTAQDFLIWSISTDQGRTWSEHNRNNGGPGGNAVDNPTTPFNSYRGDSSIVALPTVPGGVAMVTLADRRACPTDPASSSVAPCPDLVVLFVSIDGGVTFKTSIVNDRLGVGITDQPRVTVDPSDGTIWVMWRARLALTAYNTYVRGGHINASGGVDWDINGDGQLVMSTPPFPTPDYQHPRIKVFRRPGNQARTIAVTGPLAAPGTTFFTNGRCIPGATIRNSFWQYPLGVYFTVSEDNGQHWTTESTFEMGKPYALGCVGGAGGRDATGLLIYSENRIDLALDPHNNNYLVTRARAVSDSTNNVFTNNTFIGQQVEVWRRSTTPGAVFTRVFPVTPAPALPWSSANPWQFNPSIAASDDGQIAVSYYQTVGTTQSVELMVIGSRDGGNTWSAPVQLSRNSPQIATDRSLGEYDEIIALPQPPNQGPYPLWPGLFYASWSNGSGRVFAAGFSPPPPSP